MLYTPGMPTAPDLKPNLNTPGQSPLGGRITRFYTLRVVGILLSLWTYLCTLVMAAVAPQIRCPPWVKA